jgi:hypothetical protein
MRTASFLLSALQLAQVHILPSDASALFMSKSSNSPRSICATISMRNCNERRTQHRLSVTQHNTTARAERQATAYFVHRSRFVDD